MDECSLHEEEKQTVVIFRMALPVNQNSRKLATSYIKEFLGLEDLKVRKVEWGPGYLRLFISKP